jgi:predicted RNase H-like HicB family nuclease
LILFPSTIYVPSFPEISGHCQHVFGNKPATHSFIFRHTVVTRISCITLEHMAGATSYTGIIEREDDIFVALCPELDIASQGRTVEEATANLKEAVELFLDSADASEIQQRLRQPVFVTHFEIKRG